MLCTQENSPSDNFPPPIGIQFRMLSVPQIDDQLLFRSGVETEVGLVGEVVGMEQHFYKRRLRHERLRLFALSTEHSRFLPVRYVRFCIAIHYLKMENRTFQLRSVI